MLDTLLPRLDNFLNANFVRFDPTLGWDFLTSKQPVWITGLDAIAAKLITGKPLKILEAIQIIPHGVQPELKPIKLYNQIEVDPLRNDLAVKMVELRGSVKSENPALAGGLKVAANSAAFGLLCQLNVKDLETRSALHIFSGEANYATPPVDVWEKPAEFYCPVIASLVTGGSHLLCAMLERAVRDRGGHIAAMDTDSAMIVSSENGGLVPCAGGQHELKDYQPGSGHAAIRALSFAEVDSPTRQQFDALRFRPNLLLDLEQGEAFDELNWVGQVLRVGDVARIAITQVDQRCMMITLDPATAKASPAILRCVTQQHKQCAGVYGTVLTAGEVRVRRQSHIRNVNLSWTQMNDDGSRRMWRRSAGEQLLGRNWIRDCV